jgi:hypothetical protein
MIETAEKWLPVPVDPVPVTLRDGECWRCGEEVDKDGFCSFCGEMTRAARRRTETVQ